jgi:hypothetical protein
MEKQFFTQGIVTKLSGAPKKFKKRPVLYLGLKLTIHVIKSEIQLVRQSLSV